MVMDDVLSKVLGFSMLVGNKEIIVGGKSDITEGVATMSRVEMEFLELIASDAIDG